MIAPAEFQQPRRYVLLDRDGTIIVDRDYLSDPACVELLDGAAEGLRRLSDLGVGLAVLTNQSGVGRGYFDMQAVLRVNERMTALLAHHGVQLAGIYICPHAPGDGCICRKPLPGLVAQAAEQLAFDPGEAVVIGDKAADVQLGMAVAARTILVRTGYGRQTEADAGVRPDAVVDNLAAAAEVVARWLSEG